MSRSKNPLPLLPSLEHYKNETALLSLKKMAHFNTALTRKETETSKPESQYKKRKHLSPLKEVYSSGKAGICFH